MDCFTYGMLLPGRHQSSASYRYGFNGTEKDDEISGEGNSNNFGFRMYDGRLGRFRSLDPMRNRMPYLSASLHIY